MNGIVIGALGGMLLGLTVGIIRGHSAASKEFEDVLSASNERADRLEKELEVEKDKHRKAVELVNAELKDIDLKRTSIRRNDLIRKYRSDYEEDEPASTNHKVFQISVDEFKNDYAFSDGCTLSYYTGDDILVNERDEVVDISDIQLILGDEGMDKIRSTPESEIYFHNDITDTNYEIIVEHGLCFEKDILGLDGEEFAD